MPLFTLDEEFSFFNMATVIFSGGPRSNIRWLSDPLTERRASSDGLSGCACVFCRWREVHPEEPPGAEAAGAVGLRGPVQDQQRSPGRHQLPRTVSPPPPLLPHPCQVSHQVQASHILQPPAALRRLLRQQGLAKARTEPAAFHPPRRTRARG